MERYGTRPELKLNPDMVYEAFVKDLDTEEVREKVLAIDPSAGKDSMRTKADAVAELFSLMD